MIDHTPYVQVDYLLPKGGTPEGLFLNDNIIFLPLCKPHYKPLATAQESKGSTLLGISCLWVIVETGALPPILPGERC